MIVLNRFERRHWYTMDCCPCAQTPSPDIIAHVLRFCTGKVQKQSGIGRELQGNMVFHTGAALLDAIVLSVVSRDEEGTYGYKITQEVRQAIEIGLLQSHWL